MDEDLKADARSRAKRLKDVADLNDEMSGADTGKARRFTNNSDAPAAVAARKQQRDRDLFRLQLTYAERLKIFSDRLDELDRASAKALEHAERRVKETEDRMRRMHEAAAVAPDGRRIYLTKDGKHAFYEDATEAVSGVRNGIHWSPNMPTWEERTAAANVANEAAANRDGIVRFRERIQENRDRISSGDPLSLDEIEEKKLDLEQTMPDAVRAQLEGTPSLQTSAAREYMNDRPFPSAPQAALSFQKSANADPLSLPVSTPERAPPRKSEGPQA